MLYPIPVVIRVYQKRHGAGSYCMGSVARYGELTEVDGVGIYALGEGEIEPDVLRSQLGSSIEGVVVVRADSVFQAINRFYSGINYPGIVGLGGEKGGAIYKAIHRDDVIRKRPIWELPDCRMDRFFKPDGCFSISPEGWAKCRYVAEDDTNEDSGYCHCFMQEANEAPTGCLVEAYVEEASHYRQRQTDDAGIAYYPFMPEVYEKVRRM